MNDSARPCDEVIHDPSRGKLIIQLKQVVFHPIGFLQSLGAFLSAHHPFCSEFEDHTFNFRGRKTCIGCFFNFTTFTITMITLLVLWLFNLLPISQFWLFWGGGVIAALSFVVSIANRNDILSFKILSKLMLGSSFASLTFSILVAGGTIPYLLLEKLTLIFLIYIPFITILNAKRGYELMKTCDTCSYKSRWSKCPGFHDIVCTLIENGYLAPIETSDSKETEKSL